MGNEIITTGKVSSIAEDLFIELFCDVFGLKIVNIFMFNIHLLIYMEIEDTLILQWKPRVKK